MVFCGEAKKISIRFEAGPASLSDPVCTALLAFLPPKDVCCLQVLEFFAAVEIRFLARPSKADSFHAIAALIAPAPLVQVEDTTIVHAATSRADLVEQRANWEAGTAV